MCFCAQCSIGEIEYMTISNTNSRFFGGDSEGCTESPPRHQRGLADKSLGIQHWPCWRKTLPLTQAHSCTGNDLWWNVTSSKQNFDRRYGGQRTDYCYQIWLAVSIESWNVSALAMPFSVAAGCWSLENEQDGNVAFICTPSNWGSKLPCHAHQISKPHFQQVPHCLLLIQQQARGYTLLSTARCELAHTERHKQRECVCEGDRSFKSGNVFLVCVRDVCAWKKVIFSLFLRCYIQEITACNMLFNSYLQENVICSR